MKHCAMIIILILNIFCGTSSKAMMTGKTIAQPSETTDYDSHRNYEQMIQNVVSSLVDIDAEMSENDLRFLTNDDRQLLASVAWRDEASACTQIANHNTIFSNECFDIALLLGARSQRLVFLRTLLTHHAQRINTQILCVATMQALTTDSAEMFRLFVSNRAIFNRFSAQFIDTLLQRTRRCGNRDIEDALNEAFYHRLFPLCAIL